MLISSGSGWLPHPIPPSNHGPDDDVILDNHNRYISKVDVSRIYWTQIYMFGYVKTFIMVNIDKTLYFNWLKINNNITKQEDLIAINVITIVMGLQ